MVGEVVGERRKVRPFFYPVWGKYLFFFISVQMVVVTTY